VRIREVNGQYEGKVERIFPKPARSRIQIARNAKVAGVITCDGMTILWGLTKQGEEYQGGEILDPENARSIVPE